MSDNPKNRLQERFQKLRLALPSYSTSSGLDGWTCIARLYNGNTFQAKSSINKKEAEKAAAAVAIEWMDDNPNAFPFPGMPKMEPTVITFSQSLTNQMNDESVMRKASVVQNPKGELQERFQKAGLTLPSYVTARLCVDPIGFGSTVTLDDGMFFSSKLQSTKIDAEQQAAVAALEWYKKEDTRADVFDLSLIKKVWVIVDLENVGDEQSMMRLQQLERSGITITAVASGNYQNERTARLYITDVRIINTIVKEASDVFITLLIAKTINTSPNLYNKIFILSRDHFAAAIPVVMQLMGESIQVRHRLSVQQIVESL